MRTFCQGSQSPKQMYIKPPSQNREIVIHKIEANDESMPPLFRASVQAIMPKMIAVTATVRNIFVFLDLLAFTVILTLSSDIDRGRLVYVGSFMKGKRGSDILN